MASGTDALEALIVLMAYYHALDRENDQFVVQEIATWLAHIAKSPPAKHLLIDALVGEPSWIPRGSDDPGQEVGKLVYFTVLFSPRKDDPLYRGLEFFPYVEIENWTELEQQVLGGVGKQEWQSIVRDTGAPHEKTRAGALLLLYRHPESSVFEREARRALGDPSQLVRLAAAGTLAMKGVDAGEGVLLEGMSHERWEIRFWCLHGIRALGKETPLLIETRLKQETDPWLLRLLAQRAPRARE